MVTSEGTDWWVGLWQGEARGPYVSYSKMVREPLELLMMQEEHGVSPLLCQAT